MTRRLVKPQPVKKGIACIDEELKGESGLFRTWLRNSDGGIDQDFNPEYFECPYGQPGDRLWCKEAFYKHKHIGMKFFDEYEALPDNDKPYYRKVSPLFLPKYVARIALEITEVRVERLQEINAVEVLKEGISLRTKPRDGDNLERYFAELWNSLYTKKPECQWKANPWMWVVEFKRIKP